MPRGESRGTARRNRLCPAVRILFRVLFLVEKTPKHRYQAFSLRKQYWTLFEKYPFLRKNYSAFDLEDKKNIKNILFEI